jgi:putative ABC transport system permease protein
VDPDQPVEHLMTGEEFLATSLTSIRFMMNIMGTLGVLALLLASFGLYGVLAYLVARRTKELGIRMALGAASAQLMGLVLGRGFRLVGIGVLIGLPLAFALTRLLRMVLFSVSAADPLVFAVVPIGLAAVAAVACYVPARRATRVNPIDALRTD